jgi:hypothetical protein
MRTPLFALFAAALFCAAPAVAGPGPNPSPRPIPLRPIPKDDVVPVSPQDTPKSPAQEALERNPDYVGLQQVIEIDDNGSPVGKGYRAWQGTPAYWLLGPDFYVAIGRYDLAAEYRSNKRWKTGLLITAGALVLTAPLVFLKLQVDPNVDCAANDLACQDRAQTKNYLAMAVGGGLVLSGVAVGIFGLLRQIQPVDGEQARKLVAEHNSGLKSDAAPPQKQAPEVQFSLFPTAGGAGLLAVGRF